VIDTPERFSNEWWGDVLLGNPLKLASLLVLAVVVRYLVHRVIDRLVVRAAQTEAPERVLGSRRAAKVVFGGTGIYSERRVPGAPPPGLPAQRTVPAANRL